MCPVIARFRNIPLADRVVAPTTPASLSMAESGSGKEVIANEIHRRSKRKENHYICVAIDCGALSKELAGSELFGQQRKRCFTGAVNQKRVVWTGQWRHHLPDDR